MDEQKALRVMRELVDDGQLTDPDSARGKLLQVAAHLFRNKGYERTTVRDLAGAVGIQSGSIFHHFKSKDEILRAVMEETIRYNTALMRAAIAEAGSVREQVLALIRCELQSIMGGSGEAMAVLVYEWRSLSEEGQAQGPGAAGHLRRHLAASTGRGQGPPGLSAAMCSSPGGS